MIIEILTSSGKLIFETNPSVTCKTHCEFLDFPEVEYYSDMHSIVHIVKLVVSLELLNDEHEITEEIEKNLKERFWIDEENDQLIIAKMIITQFPDSWRKRMKASWSDWLDAVDADHLIIGSRADEIIERGLYRNPFANASLYYIQDLYVHEYFKGNDTDIHLLRYTFQNFIQNAAGMVFVIPQTLGNTGGIDGSPKIIKDTKMIEQYEKCGFSRIFNSTIADMVMEVEVSKLRK
ncbi:hypothetical protein [Brevibacillus halotolerans]|uniref:hypothetical protein n=1 Tax=Brevibacillus halotolerans TaxID=1507437 RepID=UPI0015EEA339|nr:hypothetical protein [Brevibacillus halotolerans]MBA4535362.1 hypothetical protein [Brevibacillus halotolerans]